jgi:hypothetical protein
MKTYESIIDALTDLKERGYTLEFIREPLCLYCYVFDLWLTPEQFNVDEIHRFEENSDPGDNAVVYAISSYTGMRGTLIDSYGVYAEYVTFEMARKFENNYQRS